MTILDCKTIEDVTNFCADRKIINPCDSCLLNFNGFCENLGHFYFENEEELSKEKLSKITQILRKQKLEKLLK